MLRQFWLSIAVLVLIFQCRADAVADESDAAVKQKIKVVIDAAGDEEKLLKLFRFRERVLITSTPAPPIAAGDKENRTSVVQVGGDWWIGTAKRDKDKVRVLCWAWSLRILLDPKSKVQAVPDQKVSDKPAFGLRVTESIKEPIDLYFDQESKRLLAIDYTDTRHVMSDWKKTDQGHAYPSHVVGFRFTDRKAGTVQDKQWYQTDILELTPLKELPPELTDDPVKKDHKLIAGTWRCVSLEVNGNQSDEADAKKISVVNGDDGTWILRLDDKEVGRGTSVIYPTQKPKTIDLTPTDGDSKGQVFLGIYILEQDTRQLCLAPAGKPRPTEFKTTPGSEYILVKFERVKN